MSSMFDFDDSVNIAFNAKQAGKSLVAAKHEVLTKTGDFLFLAHTDREFALRCQMVEADIESSAVRKMAKVSDSKSKLVRALHEEWKLRHANCACKLAGKEEHPSGAGNVEKALVAPADSEHYNDKFHGDPEHHIDQSTNKFLDTSKSDRLKGDQYKIDKNHNGKIDGEDFKILHNEKDASKTAAVVEAMARGVQYQPFDRDNSIKSVFPSEPARLAIEKRFRGQVQDPKLDWSKRVLTQPDLWKSDGLQNRGGGRFYLLRTEANQVWSNRGPKAPSSKSAYPHFTLFFSAGTPGSGLPLTAKRDTDGNTFNGYSKEVGPLAKYEGLHPEDGCGHQHIPGVQVSTAWKVHNVNGEKILVPHWDTTKRFEAGLAACPHHLIALSNGDNDRLFREFSKKNIDPTSGEHQWAYDPENPRHQELMDQIGTWHRDWQTHMGTVNVAGAHTMSSCGARQTNPNGGQASASSGVAFLPRNRSRTIGKPDREGNYSDTEFKCVPGHTSVLYDPENPDSDHAHTGHGPHCFGSHIYTISHAPPHGRGNSRDNATGGEYVGPNQDDDMDDRSTEITPNAPYELEPIKGAPKANLHEPMESFGIQKNLERQVGFTGESGGEEEGFGGHDDWNNEGDWGSGESHELLPSDEHDEY